MLLKAAAAAAAISQTPQRMSVSREPRGAPRVRRRSARPEPDALNDRARAAPAHLGNAGTGTWEGGGDNNVAGGPEEAFHLTSPGVEPAAFSLKHTRTHAHKSRGPGVTEPRPDGAK